MEDDIPKYPGAAVKKEAALAIHHDTPDLVKCKTEDGFVIKAEYWKYSSAADYAGFKGLVDIMII